MSGFNRGNNFPLNHLNGNLLFNPFYNVIFKLYYHSDGTGIEKPVRKSGKIENRNRNRTL